MEDYQNTKSLVALLFRFSIETIFWSCVTGLILSALPLQALASGYEPPPDIGGPSTSDGSGTR